jgi:hypothetical protein
MDDVVSGTDNTFGTIILWRSMRTRHVKGGAMSEEKGASGGVIEFTTVVTLDGLNRGAKLSSDIRKNLERVGNVSELRHKGKVNE